MLDWEKVKKHLDQRKLEYLLLGGRGKCEVEVVIRPLKKRLEKGERTKELYDAIMSLGIIE